MCGALPPSCYSARRYGRRKEKNRLQIHSDGGGVAGEVDKRGYCLPPAATTTTTCARRTGCGSSEGDGMPVLKHGTRRVLAAPCHRVLRGPPGARRLPQGRRRRGCLPRRDRGGGGGGRGPGQRGPPATRPCRLPAPPPAPPAPPARVTARPPSARASRGAWITWTGGGTWCASPAPSAQSVLARARPCHSGAAPHRIAPFCPPCFHPPPARDPASGWRGQRVWC